MGKFDDSITQYRKALAIDPNYAVMYALRAEVRTKTFEPANNATVAATIRSPSDGDSAARGRPREDDRSGRRFQPVEKRHACVPGHRRRDAQRRAGQYLCWRR